MRKKLRRVARDELLGALRERHSRSSKQGKGLILDELVALSGCNRNYAVQLLGKGLKPVPETNKSTRRRINDEAVKEALIVIWEASDRICGKPLKAVLPSGIESLDSHGHLQLDPGLRGKLLAISPATIDRALKSVCKSAGSRRRCPRRKNRHHQRVPIRTFADWKVPPPGLSGDRSGGPLRRYPGRILHLRPGGNRRGHRMDGSCPAAGPRTDSDRAGSRSERPAATGNRYWVSTPLITALSSVSS